MPRPLGKPRKKSDSWLFFTPSAIGGLCKLCQKDIRTKGNTTNLLNHLKRKHTGQWQSFTECGNTNFESHTSYVESDLHMVQQSQQQDASQHGVAFQSQDGNTVIWLQPTVQIEPDTVHSMQNGEIIPHEETTDAANFIATEEVVEEKAEQKKKKSSSDSDTSEDSDVEYTPKPKRTTQLKKNVTLNQTLKPLPKSNADVPPMRVVSTVGSSTVPVKEDSFDHFGRYIACLLRSLPSRKAACKLQKEMVNFIMQEQMKWEHA